jgi:glutathione S-transferase
LGSHRALHSGPWFLGEQYSAADPYAFMLCRWTRSFTSTPARGYAHIGPYLQRMLGRAAVRRVYEVEGIGEPLV